MSWKRKRLHSGKNKNYSLSRKLKQESRISDSFEIVLANLTLEEVIGLKLELSSQSVGNRLYGFPLWYAMPYITRDALLKYAFSATRTKGEAMRFLGLRSKDYKNLNDRFEIDNYFEEKT
tara:strand:+ start:9088 stop:9447 length:360 start_codon:yes stop_codon:yes gene_type:complete